MIWGERAFAAGLLDPSRPAPGLPERRYAVYRNNVVAGLIDALAAAYPAVHRLVGARFFEAAAGIFVRVHPPRQRLMILYGAAFPGWLAAFPPAGRVPYLADVARLERARLEALYAADADPLPTAAIAALPPERLAGARLALHPALRIVASPHPVVTLWAQVTGRVHGGAVDLATGETACVTRPGDAVETAAIAPARAGFLNALAARQPLAAAAGEAAQLPGFDLPAEIAALCAAGLVTALQPEEDAHAA